MLKRIFLLSLIFMCGLSGFASERVNVHSPRSSGFEEIKKDGSPNFWQVYFSGDFTSTNDAHSGKRAGLLKLKYNSSKALLSSRHWAKIEPGITYRLQIWAKGKGKILFNPSVWSESIHLGSRKVGSAMELTPEWKCYEVKLNTTKEDPRLHRIRFALLLTGKNANATFDDARIIYDPSDNPNSQVPVLTHSKTLQMTLETYNADAKLFVSGKEVKKERKSYSFVINSGITVIGIETEAAGKGSFKAEIIGHPEVAGRWRSSVAKKTEWLSNKFNDNNWKVVKPISGNRIPVSNGKQYYRQVILWNKTHYGDEMCLQPRIKTWEFSQNGFDVFHLDLASPLPYAIGDFVFHFEIPEQFKVLKMTDFVKRFIHNYPAEKVTINSVSINNEKYSQYEIFYGKRKFKSDKIAISKIPVKLKGHFSVAECKFYYYRTANGNFTELKQTLPVKILPKVNGAMPEKIIISLWHDTDYSGKSNEFIEEDIKSITQAGVNYFDLNPRNWEPRKEWREYIKYHYDTVIKNGGKFFLGGGDFPCNYGRSFKGHAPLAAEWLKKHKGSQARYFMDKIKWGSRYTAHAYCPEYILSPEGKEFWDIVKKEYQIWTKPFPKVVMKWTDWEYHVIQNKVTMNYCFCDLCKKAFRKYAGINENVHLDDEIILKRYRNQWTAFKNWQDGRIQGRIRDVSHQLGWRYMVYSWSWNKGFFKECKNNVDTFFVGCPGDAIADSYTQKEMDDMANFFLTETGIKQTIGQRFAFRYLTSGISMLGRGRISIFSYDGFTHPKSWKSQVLRIVAAFHGGADLHAGHYLSGGIRFYIGEATRLISKYEDIFYKGKRQDKLTKSEHIAYPNLLTLVHGKERLVLVFNESDKPLSVVLKHLALSKAVYSSPGHELKQISPTKTGLTVPAGDVVAVHVKIME